MLDLLSDLSQTSINLQNKPRITLLKIDRHWSSHCGAAETNPTRNHDVVGWIPGLAQWVKDLALP